MHAELGCSDPQFYEGSGLYINEAGKDDDQINDL